MPCLPPQLNISRILRFTYQEHTRKYLQGTYSTWLRVREMAVTSETSPSAGAVDLESFGHMDYRGTLDHIQLLCYLRIALGRGLGQHTPLFPRRTIVIFSSIHAMMLSLFTYAISSNRISSTEIFLAAEIFVLHSATIGAVLAMHERHPGTNTRRFQVASTSNVAVCS